MEIKRIFDITITILLIIIVVLFLYVRPLLEEYNKYYKECSYKILCDKGLLADKKYCGSDFKYNYTIEIPLKDLANNVTIK